MKHLEIGDDFRFGCDRAGDFTYLNLAARDHGFTLEAATHRRTGRPAGEQYPDPPGPGRWRSGPGRAHAGRPYSLSGRVLHGQKLARQLGWPTANVQLKRRRPPLRGVYLVSSLIDGRVVPGVANIGQRPTVQGDGRPHLEIHLLDFAGDLYGRHLSVTFVQKVRDEQKFASLEALKGGDRSGRRHGPRLLGRGNRQRAWTDMTDYKATLNLRKRHSR